MTSLIIARHGNTFAPDQTPTRVGRATDIPLVESGFLQAEALGRALAEKGMIPDIVYTSKLQRTIQTGERVLQVLNKPLATIPDDRFNEIDYGPDENKTENDVIARIGQEAIHDWNKNAIVPPDWKIDPEKIKQDWTNFADEILEKHPEKIVMVVTSNGVGRFAPYITGDFEGFRRLYPLKLRTGAYGIFEYDGQNWHVMEWNSNPSAD